MNTAINIISIQHQLVLGIGNTCDLNSTLQQFLQVCNARLGLTSSHIFLFQDSDHNFINRQLSEVNVNLVHYISHPRKKNGIDWCSNQQLVTIVDDFYRRNDANRAVEMDSAIYHAFKIDHIGVLIMESNAPLKETIQHAMMPVLQKLSTSCGAMLEHYALIEEIKIRKKGEQKIRYQASHDHITGICNRPEIERLLGESIKSCAQNNESAAILLVDLVHFKNINVLMGHYVGDEVLCQLAARLQSILPDNYTAARFCGDEFLILLTALPCDREKITQIINDMILRIVSVIEKPFNAQGNLFSISCFIGYETFNQTAEKVSDIIKNAELAMYEAVKNQSKKSLSYQVEMSEALNERLNYIEQIKLALKNNDFELYYQPQFNHLNQIIGVEALLRWDHPTRGYESPAKYIPIAEESDLIIEIGDFVLNQACKDIKRLEQLSLPDFFEQVSINISPKQLARDDFVELVLAAVDRNKIDPGHLQIEITETTLMNNVQHSISQLRRLLDAGVTCSIDDFGTGYSSLVYLKHLPAKELKIDRAFVMDIHKDDNNIALAKMIINLAKSLNMGIIAEGVENKQELDCLIKLGCYQYQGYYFSRPVMFNELLELML